jgi:hydroxyacylglutathione hydrolase
MQAADKQASMFGLPLRQPPDPEVQLSDGATVHVGKIPLKVIHTPGHCPGHVCFYCEVFYPSPLQSQ